MRIIAGKWRSRPLLAPEGMATRPTASRTRETLFSMLGSRVGPFEGLTVLDLFAGSGALSFEALSRGAAAAFLAEKEPVARQAIDANRQALGAEARLVAHDATRLPASPKAAELLFLDPPYHSGLATPALKAALAGGWVAPYAWISVETAPDEEVVAPGLREVGRRKVGRALLHLLRPALPGSDLLDSGPPGLEPDSPLR